MWGPAEWLESLRYLSEDGDRLHHLRNWGFTIYRTAYGPWTDQRWQQLVEEIQRQAYAATPVVCETTADDPAVQQVWSLFRLDARSDPALDGMSMEQLRLLYRNSDGGVPMNADLRSHRVFLLADEKVLSDANTSLVKCVEADYEPANHVSCNTWSGGQRYFGWMLMMSAEIVQLWKELEFVDLEKLAPRTVPGTTAGPWSSMLW